MLKYKDYFMDKQLRQLWKLAQQGDSAAEIQYLRNYSRLHQLDRWLWLLSELKYEPVMSLVSEEYKEDIKRQVREIAPDENIPNRPLFDLGEAFIISRPMDVSQYLIHGFPEGNADIVDLCIILYFGAVKHAMVNGVMDVQEYGGFVERANSTQTQLLNRQRKSDEDIGVVFLSFDITIQDCRLNLSSLFFSPSAIRQSLEELQTIVRVLNVDILHNYLFGMHYILSHEVPWNGLNAMIEATAPILFEIVQSCWIPWILKQKFELERTNG